MPCQGRKKPQLLQVEPRCIRTMNSVLTKIVQEDQKNWNLYIPSTCLANNTYVHSSTCPIPSFLRFGWELRLPLLQPDWRLPPHEYHSDFATKLMRRLKQAFQAASETLKVSHRTQKAYYDRWAIPNAYQVGDQVL